LSINKKEEVLQFLYSIKLVLQNSNSDEPKWTISTIRDKNLQCIAKLELAYEDIKEILMSLTPLDYCEGPIKDSKIEGLLWVFGKNLKGNEIYIKLKLHGDDKNQMLRVLSFHLAERKLKYYFKS
jgi:hypothetical protein